MPYTPPSHRSPASSAPTSPDASRRPSVHHASAVRPSLPRSASYLTKHRRTPSAVAPQAAPQSDVAKQPTPSATTDDLQGLATNSSIRASPPPVTGERAIPHAAILSPPDSQSSSEDDLPEVRGRKLDNLKELQDAISQIPVHRGSSPSKPTAPQEPVTSPRVRDIADGLHQSFSTGTLDDMAKQIRRASHARSNNESSGPVSKSAENSLTGSEEESDGEPRKKPQMVRKKSGELVRPALRPPSRRRPSSMPGTPTFSKAVHFDSHLEHVRHFLQVDRPLAVSAGSSPADNYESDNEFPFPGESQARSPPYEWEIIVANFPVETPFRMAQPARLERVWLSNDQKSLIGSVSVANLAFHKSVVCRFTLDYWKTTSEVGAEFVAEVQPRTNPIGHDRFQFTIKLSDLANLQSKTLFFCIRYSVNGEEFWDNNGGTDFQVDFKKKMLPQNGKKGVIGAASRPANSLPRSTNRRLNPSQNPRPMSMPVGPDEFGDAARIDFDQSLHDYLGEASTSLRLKSSKSATNLPSDNLSSRLAPPSGLAFANRYDFGASLTAAMQAAKDSMSKKPEGLYMKQSPKSTTSGTNVPASTRSNRNLAPPNATPNLPSLAPPAVPGSGSPNASISSSSYEELVNKYCFYGSKKTSPQLADGTLRSGQFDGVEDAANTMVTASTDSSSNGSPLTMGTRHRLASQRHDGSAQHFTHRPADPNPYFQHAATLMALGASPAQSPNVQLNVLGAVSPTAGNPRASSASTESPARSSSPASMVGSFQPFAGTSPSDFSYQQLQDRFPFGSEAHAATAIRG